MKGDKYNLLPLNKSIILKGENEMVYRCIKSFTVSIFKENLLTTIAINVEENSTWVISPLTYGIEGVVILKNAITNEQIEISEKLFEEHFKEEYVF